MTTQTEALHLALEAIKASIVWMEKVSEYTPTTFDDEGIDTAKQSYKAIAAIREALAAPQIPSDATHYQPHQKTYYKRVSATEWYLWSCTGKGWIESKGTSDTAEWVTLHEIALAAPQGEQPIAYLAWRDGKPSWDEDCVCEDPVYPVDTDDDRTSMPVYLHPAPAPLSDSYIEAWWRTENGLEDCDMCKLDDFTKVFRAIERHVRGGV